MKEVNRSVDDLKAVSFDILYKQVSSLITLYENNKESNDVSSSFEEIFQKQLDLLKNTVSSMKGLIGNVLEFENFCADSKDEDKDIGIIEDRELENKELDNNKVLNKEEEVKEEVSSKDVEAKEDVSIKEDNNIFNFDLPKTDANRSSDLSNSSVDNKKDDVVADIKIDLPINEENNIVDSSVSKNIDNTSNNKEEEVSNSSDVSNEVNVQNSDENSLGSTNNEKVGGAAFIRGSNNPVKAIIVNDSQYSKLKASLNEQIKKLDFGVSSNTSDDSSFDIEDMLERANTLYNEGNKEEAEKLFEKIRNMNVLVKKAA